MTTFQAIRIDKAENGTTAALTRFDEVELMDGDVTVILRGVSLLGIDSVMCPIELRRVAWMRFANDLDKSKLFEITHEICLDEVIKAAPRILAGEIRGRLVVKVS